MDKKTNSKVRILILGDKKSGKSSLVKKAKFDEFDINYYDSDGIKVSTFTLNLNYIPTEIKTHEIRSGDNKEHLLPELLVNIDSIFLMIDITSGKTLEDILAQINFLKKDLGFTRQIILVSNKIDLNNKRKISKLDMSTFAKENQIKLVEISIKDNININKLFNTILVENPNDTNGNEKVRPFYSEAINSSSNADIVYKITLLGNGSVGKTSFFNRYLTNDFAEEILETIGKYINTYNYT